MPRDVLTRLSRKSQGFALELIFSHLSYEEHKSAEKVSIEWRHILSNNSKIWKNLLEKNVKLITEWNDMQEIIKIKHSETITNLEKSEFHQWMCSEIHNSLQRVEENWLTGSCTTYQTLCESIPFEEAMDPDNPPEATMFRMNKQSIFRCRDDERIEVWNRWTLELEHVFDYPFPEEANDPEKPEILSLFANEELVVADFSFADPPDSICIWNLNTKQLVYNERYQVPSNLSDEGTTLRMKNRLLLCYTACNEDQLLPVEGDENVMNAFWLLPLNEDGPITEEKTMLFTTSPYDFEDENDNEEYLIHDFEFDDFYILILYYAFGVAHYEARNRSGDILRDIEVEYAGWLMYSNGLFATISSADLVLRVWNMDEIKEEGWNGRWSGHLLETEPILYVKFVQDKYIATINKRGQVKIWDLQLLLVNGSSSPANSDSLLIDYFSQPDLRLSHFKQVGELDRIMQLDQYQIALGMKSLLRNGGVADWIYILDFVDDRNVTLLTDILTIEEAPIMRSKRVKAQRRVPGSVHSSSGVWQTSRLFPSVSVFNPVAKRQRRHSV